MAWSHASADTLSSSSSPSSRSSSPTSTPSSSPPASPTPIWRRKSPDGSNWRASKTSGSAAWTSPSWRRREDSPSPPESASQSSRVLLPALEDVKVGQVFYLPDTHNQGGHFGHPVVVISKNLAQATVTFRLCTSFTQKTGSKGILMTNKSPACRKQHLLIDNFTEEVAAHDGTRKLTMAPGSGKFSKPTYVNIENSPITMGYAALEQWRSSQPILFGEEAVARISA
ncbi:unnamed protein product [Periconia digitata]|uniref:Uncharacterized protein n=1 Tax=Periconia digitata TaxID=1303443 RepID=A0A9W4UN69_9PLEO|nr:unnamed protein product [Periconia digitata]